MKVEFESSLYPELLMNPTEMLELVLFEQLGRLLKQSLFAPCQLYINQRLDSKLPLSEDIDMLECHFCWPVKALIYGNSPQQPHDMFGIKPALLLLRTV